MSSAYVPLLFFCLLLGISGSDSMSDLGNDRKLLKKARGCRNRGEYLCDCERVSATLYKKARTVFQSERLDCEPVCGRGKIAGDCKSSCGTVFCVAKYGDYCASKLNRTQANSIRLMDCEFSARFQMHVCTRDEYRMEVDDPTFIAVTNGSCVPACGVEEEGLMCHFNARLFGDAFIPEDIEAPFEPPEITPPSSVIEEEDEIPFEPPSAAYSFEDYKSAEEPSLEDIYTPISPPEYEFNEYSIPEPSYEEEYSIPESSLEEEYSIPEPSYEEEYSTPEPSIEEEYIFEEPLFEYDHSTPEPSFDYGLNIVDSIDKIPVVLEDEFFSVDIRPVQTGRPTTRNEVYYGAWSNCTQHCGQARNGTRERSVLCRNLFGIPLPPSECRDPMDVDLVESCPTVSCVGDFYYLLSEWSACSQTCSIFITETESMSVGTRRRTMYCFHENGTETETANCAQQVGNLDFLVDTCGEMPCSPVRYRVSSWTDCSCQTNTRNRSVECVDNRLRPILDAMCDALEIQRPSKTQTCIPTGC